MRWFRRRKPSAPRQIKVNLTHDPDLPRQIVEMLNRYNRGMGR